MSYAFQLPVQLAQINHLQNELRCTNHLWLMVAITALHLLHLFPLFSSRITNLHIYYTSLCVCVWGGGGGGGGVVVVIVGSWIYNYICNQCLPPLLFRISIRARCTTLCDKVYQWLVTGRWFSPGPSVSSTNKTDRHDITEILVKVALNTIKQTKQTNKQQTLYCAGVTLWCLRNLQTINTYRNIIMEVDNERDADQQSNNQFLYKYASFRCVQAIQFIVNV